MNFQLGEQLSWAFLLHVCKKTQHTPTSRGELEENNCRREGNMDVFSCRNSDIFLSNNREVKNRKSLGAAESGVVERQSY